MEIFTEVKLKRVDVDGHHKLVKAKVASREHKFKAEQILMATGRRPNTANLGLEKIDLNLGFTF